MSGGLFFGINIALRGMMAQQAALNVTSHNIANANTPGYSRQRAQMETSIPLSGLIPGAGQLGSGVDVAEINRIRDEFVDYQVRSETSKLGQWESIGNTLEQIETVFMEPSETGFNSLLNQFWADWQELSKNAESSPIRTNLKETAVSLAESFRHMHSQLSDLLGDIQRNIDVKIADINSISQQIARLNEQIVNIKITGDNPNDLMDKRDSLLDELSKIGNIAVSRYFNQNGEATGAIEVSLGSTILVNESGAQIISSASPEEGELAGLLKAAGDSVDTDAVQYYINKLDSLAVGLAKAVNDLHIEGKALDGSSGRYFFSFRDENGEEIDLSTVDWNNPFDSGLSAANIYINSEITNDVSKIQAAGQIPTGVYKESLSTLPDEENSDGTVKSVGAQFSVAGPISFEINGEVFAFDAAFINNNSIFDMVDTINASSDITNVEAYYDADIDKFSLATTDKGSTAQIVINDTDNFLQDSLKLDVSTETGEDDGMFLKGNGDTALEIAKLQNQTLAYDAESGVLSVDASGSTTLGNFYKEIVAELGVASGEAQRMIINQETLVNQLEQRREAISGVSLDEEMANMIRFQHAFQANARVISVIDELLDTVVNGLIR